MKIKIKIIIFLLIILAFSCSSSNKEEIKKKLYEKYDEKFYIFNDSYSIVAGEFQFQAAPLKNKKFVFSGTHNKNFTWFADFYIHQYLNDKYAKLVKSNIEKYTQPVYVFTRLTFDEELYDYDKVNVYDLDLNNFFENSIYLGCDIIIYFFKELTPQTKNELLSEIYETIKPYKKHPNASVLLSLYFWDPKFLNKHSLDDLEYNRLITDSPQAVNFDLREKYVVQELTIYFDTSKPFKDFDIDTIYSNVVKDKNSEASYDLLNLNRLAEEE